MWWYDFSIAKTRYRNSCFTTKKYLAEEYANKVFVEAYKNKKLNIKNPTFKQCWEYFCKHNVSYMARLTKAPTYQLKLTAKLAIEFFKDKKIDSNACVQFFTHVQNTRKLSSRTVCKYIESLSVIFKFCVSHEIMNSNPLTKANLTSYHKEKKKIRVRFLEKHEYTNLLATCKQIVPEIAPYIQFAKETGLRQGEQLSLTWEQIDFHSKTIYLIKTKTDMPRTVPLSPKAFKILQKAWTGKIKLEKPFPLPVSTLNTKWYKLLKQTELKNFHWHDLRHSFASWAVKGWHTWQKKPMDLYRVSRWLGHSDIKMTQRYAHLQIDDLKEEIQED